MFSKIVFIIFAANFIFYGSGMSSQGSLRPFMKCYEATKDAALAFLEAMEDHPDTDADKIKFTCLTMKVYGSCLVGVIKASSPVPKLYHFLAAMEYQHNVLLKKAGLCPNKPYDELKKITLESGIMKKEKLVNIEADDIEKCAGDALKKCIIKDWTMFEHRVDLATQDAKYIECMEDEAKTCTAPIMKHFMGLVEAFRKHLKEIIGKIGEE